MATTLAKKERMKQRILNAMPVLAHNPSLMRTKRVVLADGSVIRAFDIAATAETVERSSR